MKASTALRRMLEGPEIVEFERIVGVPELRALEERYGVATASPAKGARP